MEDYSIGKLAKLSGCKVPTIRYYEQIGLLPEAKRTEGNQRRYNSNHLTQLKFVLHARELGFGIAAIEQLQHLADGHCQRHNPHEAGQIAKQHLADIERRIARLEALREELSAMVSCCDDQSEHQCRVLEVLADHKLCKTTHGCD